MLTRPTLRELVIRIQTDIVISLSTVAAIVRKATSRILGKITAGAAHLLYGYIDDRALQMFVSSAQGEYLDLHAADWTLPRKAATFATGSIVCTGQNGAVIPAGSIVQNSNGNQFVTDADGTIVNETVTIAVTAQEPGKAANTEAGEVITFVSTIDGVESEAEVSGTGITGGTDTEDDEPLRNRILTKKRLTGLGGNESDWITWVKNFGSLQATRVWAFPQYNGSRTVGIFFVLDNAENIIPSAENVAAVQTYLRSLRPVGCTPYVYAPIETQIWFSLSLYPFTADVQTSVLDSLERLFYRESTVGGTIRLSHIREAISVAAGETDSEIDAIYISGDEAPVQDIVLSAGLLPVFVRDNVTFQEKV